MRFMPSRRTSNASSSSSPCASLPSAATRASASRSLSRHVNSQHREEFEADTEVDNERMRTAFFDDPEGNRAQIVWRSRPLGS